MPVQAWRLTSMTVAWARTLTGLRVACLVEIQAQEMLAGGVRLPGEGLDFGFAAPPGPVRSARRSPWRRSHQGIHVAKGEIRPVGRRVGARGGGDLPGHVGVRQRAAGVVVRLDGDVAACHRQSTGRSSRCAPSPRTRAGGTPGSGSVIELLRYPARPSRLPDAVSCR